MKLLMPLRMSEDRVADLLQMPDLEADNDLFTSAKDNGKAMIDEALRSNTYTPPSPFMDLPMFIIDANEAEQRAERMKLPEQNISTLRRMIRRANELEQKKQQARQMQQMGAITPAASPTDESGVSPNSITNQANQQVGPQ